LPPLWAEFLNRIDEIENKVAGVGYGVVQQTKEGTDLLEYFAAFEVSKLTSLPRGMVSIEIPASTYAKFTHRGEVKNINNTVNYVYSNWLLKSGMRHSYAADLEIYGAEYHPVADSSVIYYAIPLANT